MSLSGPTLFFPPRFWEGLPRPPDATLVKNKGFPSWDGPSLEELGLSLPGVTFNAFSHFSGHWLATPEQEGMSASCCLRSVDVRRSPWDPGLEQG